MSLSPTYPPNEAESLLPHDAGSDIVSHGCTFPTNENLIAHGKSVT